MKVSEWFNGQQNKPKIVEDDDNSILVRDEWYQYYRECARKLRLILRIIDHTGLVNNNTTMNTVIGEAHRDMRKLADVLDPEEMNEWLLQRKTSPKPKKVQILNERKKELYAWLKRAKAVEIEPLPANRPSDGQRKRWEKSVIKAEELNKTKDERRKGFDIGKYKRECIYRLKYLKQGSSILVEDRIKQTVDWWITEMSWKKEFNGKMFNVEEVDHNTQRIWRVK